MELREMYENMRNWRMTIATALRMKCTRKGEDMDIIYDTIDEACKASGSDFEFQTIMENFREEAAIYSRELQATGA